MHEDAPVLTAKKRERTGSRYSRREREAGGLPAVVYGHKQEPAHVTLDAHEAISHIQKGEKVFQLEYTLKRAHAEADLEALKTALKGAGYEQHAETPTASASVLVSKSSLAKSEILVSPTSGKTSLSVSITKM